MPQWKLASANPPVTMLIEAGDTGAVSGTITSGANTYAVSGTWAASNSVPGRYASAVCLAGQSAASAPAFMALAGIMVGPGTRPVSLTVQLAESSSADGLMRHSSAVLTPS